MPTASTTFRAPQALAIVELQQISIRRAVDFDYLLVLEFRHHPFLEGKPVSRKRIKPTGIPVSE